MLSFEEREPSEFDPLDPLDPVESEPLSYLGYAVPSGLLRRLTQAWPLDLERGFLLSTPASLVEGLGEEG